MQGRITYHLHKLSQFHHSSKIAGLVSLILWFFISTNWSCSHSGDVSHKPNNQPRKSEDQILADSLIRTAWQDSGCIGLAYAVVKHGKTLVSNTKGIQSVGTYLPVTSESVFRIASLSKGFTGMLSAVLIQKGYFSLEDPIARYLPGCSLQGMPTDSVIRIRHLLSHSTGLTEHAFSNLIDQEVSRETWMAELCQMSVRDTTGTRHAYQNAAFSLMEAIIENVLCMPFKDALKKFLLTPLGMGHTGASFEDFFSSSAACQGHFLNRYLLQTHPLPVKANYYNAVAAGGIHSTLSDMTIWLKAVMGHRPEVLSAEVIRLATTPTISTLSEDRHFNQWPGLTYSGYGLGWRRLNVGRHSLIFHGGYVNGFRSEIAFDPVEDIGFVLLSNSNCSITDQATFAFFQKFWKMLEAGEKVRK